jgi:GntR family transcriptional regulator, transcriptional repressor for pyruvate dehydrogenase complex
MDGVGLVAYVEKQMERDIALKKLPRGQWGSERKLARVYGVCRGTVREALRRLGARGLVMQRPGRMARAVGLELSLTLENVGLALHDERSQEGRWWLEGFFSLKRQVLVDLLAECCASASEEDLGSLERTCFALWDAGKWESGEHCAQLEFELLRRAARGADRPGQLLLVQSLQWALWGSASRLLSHMDGEAVRPWASCAMYALASRDVKSIREELPALLKACDERVLERFGPAPQCHLDAPDSTPRDVDSETRPDEEPRSPGGSGTAEQGDVPGDESAGGGVRGTAPPDATPGVPVEERDAEPLGHRVDCRPGVECSCPRRGSGSTGPPLG